MRIAYLTRKNFKSITICSILLLTGSIGACSTNFSTARNTSTGSSRIYAMSGATALAIAHDAISQSFPDSEIERIDGPTSGYSTYLHSGFDTSLQKVIIHPVTGVTTSGTTVDGYSFEVSGRGTIGAGDINTASFYARLQQVLDTTGDVVTVVRSEPRPALP